MKLLLALLAGLALGMAIRQNKTVFVQIPSKLTERETEESFLRTADALARKGLLYIH